MLQYTPMKNGNRVIKTLWFDLGNVVLFFDFEPAFKKLSRYTRLKLPEIRSYFKQNPRLEEHLDEGRISASHLYHRLVRDLDLNGCSFGEFKRIWNRIFKENQPVVNLVGRLKRNGYRLILISNTNRLHYEYLVKHYPVLSKFDHHVLSFRVGARKPKQKIFKRALSLSRAKREEIYYTDDRNDLTHAALSNHGIHTHTFHGIGYMRRDLRRLGVRIQ